MYPVACRGVDRSRCGSVMALWWCLVISVVVDVRIWYQVRHSHFLLRLCKVGPALQPKGGEHVYLSSRRSIVP